MAVRKYKPTTPGRRGASVSSFDEITRAKPERSLVGGRNRAAGTRRPDDQADQGGVNNAGTG